MVWYGAKMFFRRTALTGLLLLSACGGGKQPNRSEFGAAALAALLPRGIALDSSDAVLKTPKVVAITYDADPFRADLEAFVAQYAASTAWGQHTTEYGVGPLVVRPPQHLTDDPPAAIDDTGITDLLDANLGGASPAWGAPDPDTIYTLFFPAGTIVDDGTGSTSCDGWDGYHSDYTVDGVTVPYAVVVACPGFDGPGFTELDQITVVASHELVEAATDPFDDPSGYAEVDAAHAVFTVITGGELADLCGEGSDYGWTPSDMTYKVQRSWSNAAAAAGHDPCVGNAAKVYAQTIPDQPDALTVLDWTTRGARLSLGQTRTVRLTVYSDDPTSGPYLVEVEDYAASNGDAPLLSLSLPTGRSLRVGDSIELGVKALGWDPEMQSAAAFVIKTRAASGSGPTTIFYGLVGE